MNPISKTSYIHGHVNCKMLIFTEITDPCFFLILANPNTLQTYRCVFMLPYAQVTLSPLITSCTAVIQNTPGPVLSDIATMTNIVDTLTIPHNTLNHIITIHMAITIKDNI